MGPRSNDQTGREAESAGRLSGRTAVLLLLLFILAGTGLRLLVISNTAYLANSSYSSYMKSSLNFVDSDKVFLSKTGEWIESNPVFEEYFVLKGDGPRYSGLFWQLVRSNHPPLYYVLLHSLIGLSPDKTATPGKGFAINMAGFWLSAFLVGLLGFQLTRDYLLGLFAGFLYSVNPLSMEAFVLHKGYELQVTFILLVLALVFSFQDKTELRIFHYFCYGTACVSAFLVHYYSYLWVAGICLIILAQYTWISWNPGRLVRMAIATLIAVFTAVLTYPPIIHDLLTDHRSLEIREKLISPESHLWFKAQVGLDRFASYIMTFPYHILVLITFAAVILAAILKPEKLRFNCLGRKGKWIFLAMYAGAFYWFMFFLSPFQNLRYVSPVIPLVPLIAAGFLQVLPASYRFRVVVVSSVFFLSFSLFGLARVFNGDISSSHYISDWRSRSVIEDLDEDGSVIAVSNRIREKLYPVFYHTPPRKLAVCINRIPGDLFNRPGEMLVLLDDRYPRRVIKDMVDGLDQRGFRQVGRFGGFIGFLRESEFGKPGTAPQENHSPDCLDAQSG